jgi:hypothetical protein
MNLLEHYIIEVKKIAELQMPEYIKEPYVEVEVFCDCCGDKRVIKHVATRANWIREMAQGYFMA